MVKTVLTDTHCHINAPEFVGRVEDVLARARLAGVGAIIMPSWHAESARKAFELASTYPMLRPAVGLHPWFATADATLDWLPPLLDDPRLIAMGEIGLDWTVDTDHGRQEELFRAQLALAYERDLPVVLHAHRGWDRLLACLDDYPVRGVAHAFSGSLEVLHECLRRGLYISFAGMVTRPNSRRAHAAAAAVPADRLLIETDAPYMTFDGIPSGQSEPAHLPRVLAFLAALRQEDPDSLAAHIEANVYALFNR